MTKITMIMAMDTNNLVGDSTSKFGLPWHYPSDLKYYKEQTKNKKTIMGHNTYKLIGKSLPDRETIVLSSQKIVINDAKVINNYKDIFKYSDKQIMITGGISVYKLYLPYADEILITRINKAYIGDAYYLDLNLEDFKLTKQYTELDGELSYQTWERYANFRPRN